jgi:hypothetical protein
MAIPAWATGRLGWLGCVNCTPETVNGRGAGALIITVVLAAVLGWVNLLGTQLLVVLAAGVALALLVWAVPWFSLRHFETAQQWLRERLWGAGEGGFHSFAGVAMTIHDDGRHVWVDGQSLMRVLGRREAEDVLAARHTGRWQRDENGVLMLRVDAVVQRLAAMPGRDEPRVQRLRRYFEREVLFPASQRRTRR